MLRSFFGSLSRSTWAQRTFSRWAIAKKLASRFIAGESSAEAIQVIRQLNERGIQATLDHLGENTTTREEATQAVDEVIHMIDEIERCGARANVSIKLSQMGLNLDADFCLKNVQQILAKASASGNFVRIDMEDSSLTEKTLAVFMGARQMQLENCGIVIQAYLYRSEADIRQILTHAGKGEALQGSLPGTG